MSHSAELGFFLKCRNTKKDAKDLLNYFWNIEQNVHSFFPSWWQIVHMLHCKVKTILFFCLFIQTCWTICLSKMLELSIILIFREIGISVVCETVRINELWLHSHMWLFPFLLHPRQYTGGWLWLGRKSDKYKYTGDWRSFLGNYFFSVLHDKCNTYISQSYICLFLFDIGSNN